MNRLNSERLRRGDPELFGQGEKERIQFGMFRGLRFHLEGGAPEAVHERIGQAEKESTRTCERCGAPGELKAGGSGYRQTLCGRCRKRSR